MNIENAIAKHRDALMRLPNVVGVGIGEKQGRPVIKVLVTRKVTAAKLPPHALIPAQIEGYETDVEPIGDPTIQ
jgi:hypothetical protein